MSQFKLEKSYKYQIQEKKDLNPETNKVLRVYADGVFDCFHFGHARQLQQAKSAGEKVFLIAGVSSHEDTYRFPLTTFLTLTRYKGKTLMDETERTLTVSACCWVDEVLCPCPWALSEEFLDVQSVDFVAHDAIPYQSAGSGDIYQLAKQLGKFFETQRTEGISTSDLIQRIIVDRECWKEYLLKNGTKRTVIGVGVLENIWIECKFIAKALFCLKRKKNDENEEMNSAKTKAE